MDATVQLVIIEKLRALFAAEPGSYLACPVTPTVYRRDQLETAGTGSSNAEELAQESAWIRSVNFVPVAGVLMPNESSYLWDVLTDLKLHKVTLAESAELVSEEAAKEAGHLLYENPDAVPLRPSEAYRRYLELQDLHLEVVQLFRQRQQETENSPDPAVVEFWNGTMKPALQSKIDEAMFQWEQEGRKKDIEGAKRILAEAGTDHTQEQWDQWGKQFNAQIDAAVDLNLVQFVPTSFSPPGITSQAGWAEMTVDSGSYETLAGTSPVDVKQRFYSPDPGFVSVSFECARVAIERAWFPRGLFESRIWKPLDPELRFSDGGDPPSGKLPGYVVGVLLVRNIQVTKLAPKPADTAPTGHPFKNFKNFQILKAAMGGPMFKKMAAAEFVAVEPAPATAPVVAATSAELVMAKPAIAFNRVAEFKAIDATEVQAAVANRKDAWRIGRNFDALNDVKALDTQMQDLMKRKMPTVIAASMPTVAEQPLAADDVCVIGFLWKGFPASPNPDPGLTWPSA